MWINREHLVLTNTPLVGFGGTKVYPLSAITLLVMIGNYPQQIIRDVTFLVIDCSFAYNAIIGRPTLNLWKVVTSIYHLMIKFPIEYGVGELRGNQVVACECYIAMLEMDDHLQTMSIEEQWKGVEPVKRLEEIPLNSSRLDKTTRIDTLDSLMVRLALVAFLKKNQDVFA